MRGGMGGRSMEGNAGASCLSRNVFHLGESESAEA